MTRKRNTRASGRIMTRVNFGHVLRTIEAKLEKEGFILDTEDRRRIIAERAGPRPVQSIDIELLPDDHSVIE